LKLSPGNFGRPARPRQCNSVKDFADKKVSLHRRQVIGDDFCVNAQTKHRPRIARRFGFNHDLAQHRSSNASRRFVWALSKWRPHAAGSCNGAGHSPRAQVLEATTAPRLP